jgi:hypothetical protein
MICIECQGLPLVIAQPPTGADDARKYFSEEVLTQDG